MKPSETAHSFRCRIRADIMPYRADIHLSYCLTLDSRAWILILLSTNTIDEAIRVSRTGKSDLFPSKYLYCGTIKYHSLNLRTSQNGQVQNRQKLIWNSILQSIEKQTTPNQWNGMKAGNQSNGHILDGFYAETLN